MLHWTAWNRTDYLYKIDLALNNLQRLICHKTQLTNHSWSGRRKNFNKWTREQENQWQYTKPYILEIRWDWKEGGRRFAIIEYSVNTSIRRLEEYIKKKSKERLITTTRNNTRINRTAITRKQKWEEKQMYGYFKRQTSKISHENAWK